MNIEDISILDYLSKRGIEARKEGPNYYCSSPFSSDKTPSLCIYPTNTFYDFSNGFGGNVVILHAKLNNITNREAFLDLIKNNEYKKYEKQFKEERKPKKFNFQNYVNNVREEVEQIERYAKGRGIVSGFTPGFFYEYPKRTGEVDEPQAEGEANIRSDSGPGHGCEFGKYRKELYVRVPSMMFVHVDKNLNPCGAKFRRVDGKEPRFSARGKLGIYYLPKMTLNLKSTSTEFPTRNVLYVVESESSANSLWEYLRRTSTVISMGGVAVKPKPEQLPEHLAKMPKKLIIDYDGNEKLYNERLKLYDGLGAEPIKLRLPKGEDINSLYTKNKMYLIDNLI